MNFRRFSVRKCFVYLLAIVTLLVIALNVRLHDWSTITATFNAPENPGVTPSPEPLQPVTPNPPENRTFVPSDVTHAAKFSNPWFMKDGQRRPKKALLNSITGKRRAKLFPEESKDDRIVNQLMYIPPSYDGKNVKTILPINGLSAWGGLGLGSKNFEECPVSACSITTDRSWADKVDAILFKDNFVNPGTYRPFNQIWILYFLECPHHTPLMKYASVFNWTATYRTDSDIVAPYERWEYYDNRVKQISHLEKNYAANKTKKVAWFVSNCGARNGRLQYAQQLQKYIDVDIYGACGPFKCSRSTSNTCFELLDRDYKFYLAFENSNCRDYITEKLYVNGLGRDILPIVMGARPEDYERSAPYRSYIHVDEFESPKELADYLHRLDKDDELYNSYFRWKGTGEFINTFFWCRLCAMLHDDAEIHKNYSDINEWWRGDGVCSFNSWRNPPSATGVSGNFKIQISLYCILVIMAIIYMIAPKKMKEMEKRGFFV